MKDDETIQMSLSGETIEDDSVIMSAHVSTNAKIFPKVLNLHISEGADIADVTYGKGVFWKQVSPQKYNLTATDINPEKSPDSSEGVDCRNLPYEDNSYDCIVLDPPYAAGFFRDNPNQRPGQGSHGSFRDSYTSANTDTSSKYHQAVLDLYYAAGDEAKRVIRENGHLIIKVQDEVVSNTQNLTHVEVINYYENELNLYSKDLFVVVRPNKPNTPGMENQVHARKNHSYFIVFEN